MRFAAEASAISNRMLLTLGSLDEVLYVRKPVGSITVPGTERTFTVTNHSLIVSQLKAGVISVREGSDMKDYFISDGFLFFNHSTVSSGCCTAEISAVDVVPTFALDNCATHVRMYFAKSKQRSCLRTACSHIRNMFDGVTKVPAQHAIGVRRHPHQCHNYNMRQDGRASNFSGLKDLRVVNMYPSRSAALFYQSCSVKNKDILRSWTAST